MKNLFKYLKKPVFSIGILLLTVVWCKTTAQTLPLPVNSGFPPPTQIPPPNPQIAPPPPGTPPGWGAPGYLTNAPTGSFNQGTLNVMATGYDSESVLVQIPLVVSYYFNGATYNVNVLNAWNPLTQTWTLGLDIPASSTDYYFNGFTYNFTVNLPTGTFYFNL